MTMVDPIRDERGWAFTDDVGGPDPINGFRVLAEAYRVTDPSFDGRVTVPTLWDKKTGQVVNNELPEILRMLNLEFDEWAIGDGVDGEAPSLAWRGSSHSLYRQYAVLRAGGVGVHGDELYSRGADGATIASAVLHGTFRIVGPDAAEHSSYAAIYLPGTDPFSGVPVWCHGPGGGTLQRIPIVPVPCEE